MERRADVDELKKHVDAAVKSALRRERRSTRAWLVMLGCGALVGIPAFAAALPTRTFSPGDPILASDSTELWAAVEALEVEEPLNVLESVSDTNQTGVNGADLVYSHVGVTLTAGTWLVEAQGTVTTNVTEAVQIGLHDATRAVDLVSSRSGVGTTTAGLPYALHTSEVLVITAPTTIRIKAYRNGSSTLTVGNAATVLAGGRNRIMAIQLR